MAYDEALAVRVRDELRGKPGLTEQKMFGGLGFMLDGRMVAAAGSRGRLMLRVPPERADELAGHPGVAPVEMRGRPMRGWLDVDAAVVGSDDDLAGWLALAVGFVSSLPPK